APLDLDGHCIAAAFVGNVPFFAMAGGTVHRLDHGEKAGTVHDGLLCAVLDPAGKRLITGGEDGKVRAIAADGSVTDLGGVERKWITSVAAGPQGAIAYAAGRTAHVRFADGKVKSFDHPRTVEGLAFSPKGMRFGV